MKLILATALAMISVPAFPQDMPAPPAQTTPDPVGGYQPAPMPSIPAGSPVVFQPAPPPSVAFPAPAPMANYPVCKRGQYDKCIERHSPK